MPPRLAWAAVRYSSRARWITAGRCAGSLGLATEAGPPSRRRRSQPSRDLDVRLVERLFDGIPVPGAIKAGCRLASDADRHLPAVGHVREVGNRGERLEHLLAGGRKD